MGAGLGGLKRRTAAVVVAAIVFGGLAAAVAPAAEAAEYASFVTCSAEPGVPLLPAHACAYGQQPQAFFESETTVTFHSCLLNPIGKYHCGSDTVAEAGKLYVSKINPSLLGKYEVAWFVEGTQVGTWPFEVLTAEEEEEPPRPPRTLLACAGKSFVDLVFFAHPHQCVDLVKVEGATGPARMRNVRWRDWNSPTAQGQGQFSYCGKRHCLAGRARIAAYDRKFACGRYAYTRLLIHVAVRGRRERAISVQLPPC